MSDPFARSGVTASPALISTGIAIRDLALGGGLPRDALTVSAGASRSDKTALACQIVSALIRERGPGLILTTMAESVTKLIAHPRGFQFFEAMRIGEMTRMSRLWQALERGPRFPTDTPRREERV